MNRKMITKSLIVGAALLASVATAGAASAATPASNAARAGNPVQAKGIWKIGPFASLPECQASRANTLSQGDGVSDCFWASYGLDGVITEGWWFNDYF